METFLCSLNARCSLKPSLLDSRCTVFYFKRKSNVKLILEHKASLLSTEHNFIQLLITVPKMFFVSMLWLYATLPVFFFLYIINAEKRRLLNTTGSRTICFFRNLVIALHWIVIEYLLHWILCCIEYVLMYTIFIGLVAIGLTAQTWHYFLSGFKPCQCLQMNFESHPNISAVFD